MSSRQEQKEKLRKERLEREQAEKASARRRRRFMILGGALAALVVVVIVVVVASSGGSKKTGKTQAGTNGLQVSAGPWVPEFAHLPQRLKAMGLPDPSDTVYHVHAEVQVYVDGKRQVVPQGIGIDQQHQLLASLHTHDTRGVVHQEAVQPYPFTLGQFFNVWGVLFSPTQLGAYHAGKGLVLQTWVNGKQVPNGPAYKLKPHDVIVVGFGKPGSFPTKPKFTFDPGE